MFEKIETKTRLILSIRGKLKFLGHIRRKELLEMIMITGHIEGKRVTGNSA